MSLLHTSKTLLFCWVLSFFIVDFAFSKNPTTPVKVIVKDNRDTSYIENLKLSLDILTLIVPYQVELGWEADFRQKHLKPANTCNSYQFSLESDTCNIADDFGDNIENTLDSLWNVFEVKEYVSKNNLDISKEAKVFKYIEDSVYIARLNKIPSIMHLSYNNVVRNFIEMYTQKKRTQVEVMLGLSEYYFPFFEQVLDEYNLPIELKYLPVIESALNPSARSWAGATGLWQFMYYTGKMYQLKVDSYVDERSDPLKSTYAAARYLRDLYKEYHDWTLVIAAYNCGPGNVNKAIRRAGGQKDYWKIYHYLPRETRGYVPAFIGATYAMNFYHKHELSPRKVEISLNNDTIMVSKNLHFQQISDVLKIPIEQLRDMNPQYRTDIIPGNFGTYSLRLPDEFIEPFIDMQDSIFAYKDSLFFNKDLRVDIPSPTYAKHKYDYDAPSPKNKTKIYHTVKPGDNIGHIAQIYKVQVSDIRKWNNIRGNKIIAGKKLSIYVSKGKEQNYSSTASSNKSGTSSKSKQNITADAGNSNDFVYYKVRKGDNLWTIAKKYPGVSNSDIMRLNNLSSAEVKPGDLLKIKKI
jgi:membrane-bound lytic murein transglycosylase D